MSRVIVKGLPKYLTEERLKQHFVNRIEQRRQGTETKDLITDVKLIRNRLGESRRFAFLGFRSEEDALDAVRYFDGSFIDTSKIEVAMAKTFADPSVPTPMKEKRREALKRLREKEEKLLEETRAKKKAKEELKKPSIDAEIQKNKQLQEFIETMKPSSQLKSWDTLGGAANNSEEGGITPSEAPPVNSLLSQALALRGDDETQSKDVFKALENESDDEYTTLDKVENEDEDKEQMVSLGSFNSGESETIPEDDNIAQDEKVSDLDWLKQRRVRISEHQENNGGHLDGTAVQKKDSNDEENHDVGTSENQKTDQQDVEEQSISDEEKIIQKIKETGRLFLRNILYTSTESDFRQLFSPFGKLEEVHVALDTRTGKSKGFAYVLFSNPEDAVNAYIELDKQIFQGRLLHILPADAKKTHRLDEFDLKNLPLKKQKALKRKANAAQETFSWNSLYMSQDAVLSSVASKLGVEKSDLIDATDSGAAVKQALAEAHVIGDVRKYFESKGVDLAKFSQFKSPSERDDCVILVKNFPFGTTREEIAELFLSFGKLQRVLMPPARTIAIIQFRDASAARAAFTKLSYKRFKDGILYLEKGPKGCFTRNAQDDETVEAGQDESNKDVKEVRATVDDVMDVSKRPAEPESETVSEDIFEGPTVSIFIKNLNFSTTTTELSAKFKPFEGFVVAQVKTKPDPKRQGKTLSMGFGFAEFRTKDQALAAISALDGSVLDGHRVQLKLSHRAGSAKSATKGSKKKTSGKIIVKNLPFEAARKDVFELFSSFGQLKSVRVPKKFDKSARGFAFVEFLLPKEAENAMDQLQGVHLLGRRLVMQYAEQEPEDAEEQIERMTRKVKSQVATREQAAMRNGGKRKLELDDDVDENDGLNGI
ncbi:LAFE_0E08922g1_1 [Lachancea fermentati]|uniref:Multiple RNA-binding domain-containing protein 1 n=1 Tax=Lachancea fermentati TaxID=4955 RepID=A0A1G4MDB5_LACFM|nr:LAFE_0E08922g1_1 [Lachancea fermentati]